MRLSVCRRVGGVSPLSSFSSPTLRTGLRLDTTSVLPQRAQYYLATAGGVLSSRSYATKKAAPAGKAKAKTSSGPKKSKKPLKNKKIKIVLTDDVPSVGVKGEDVEVAKGFARNFLFPKKLAVYCTEENIKLYEAERANIDYDKRQKLQELAKAKKRLSKVEVLMKRQIVQTEPNQLLHAPVTAANIVDKLWLQHKIQLGMDQINLDAPITQLGTFSVPVKLEDIDVALKVRVQSR